MQAELNSKVSCLVLKVIIRFLAQNSKYQEVKFRFTMIFFQSFKVRLILAQPIWPRSLSVANTLKKPKESPGRG